MEGCCDSLEKPSQPMNREFIESTREQVGSRNEYRSLNPKWCEKFSWIHVCIKRRRVFVLSLGLTQSNKQHVAFVNEGFHNWKRAVKRFQIHEAAASHKEAVLKLQSSSMPTVTEQLSAEAMKSKAEHRQMLLKVLSRLKFLLKQGLSIRGHSDIEGNLRASDCPMLAGWLGNHHYISPEINNEQITLMGNDLL